MSNSWYILRNAVLFVLFVLLTLGGANYILNDLWWSNKPVLPAPVPKVETVSLSAELRREAVESYMQEPMASVSTNVNTKTNKEEIVRGVKTNGVIEFRNVKTNLRFE